MQVVTSREGGLFPGPREIEMSCSCPDWAGMCKHVAAVLYGVGTRLDEQPQLLFKLRQVDHMELIAEAGNVLSNVGANAASADATIAAGDLADVFGIDIEAPTAPAEPAKTKADGAKAAGKKPPVRKPRILHKTSPEAPAKPLRSTHKGGPRKAAAKTRVSLGNSARRKAKERS